MAIHIDPLASVDPRAEIADEVFIGPFCVVGPEVSIGRGTRLESHVTLTGRLTLGTFNRIFPGAVLGAEPQDISYTGTPTRVAVGDHNVIREGVTINRATDKEDGLTSLGSNCFLMANSHIAHDCKVGDHVVMANGALIGGHVHVHHHATLSGNVAVHHFATIGAYSFIGGLSRVLHDIAPYMLCDGSPARPRCVNIVALKRNDFSRDEIKALVEAHRLLFRAKVGLDHARDILRNNNQLIPHVNHLLNFIEIQQEGRHGRGREVRRAA